MKKIFILALAVVTVCSCTEKGTSIKEVSVEQNVFQEITEPMSEEDNQDLKSEIAERALFLCKYIPDHGIGENAEKFMTEDYYRAYSEAFDAPKYTLGIGDEEFLYYFVSGNGEAVPKFSVKNPDVDVDIVDDIHANVRIIVEQDYGDPSLSSLKKSELLLEKVDGEWVIADFDDTKRKCNEYVKEMRRMYNSDEALENLQEEGADQERIDKYNLELEDFYKKYGK